MIAHFGCGEEFKKRGGNKKVKTVWTLCERTATMMGGWVWFTLAIQERGGRRDTDHGQSEVRALSAGFKHPRVGEPSSPSFHCARARWADRTQRNSTRGNRDQREGARHGSTGCRPDGSRAGTGKGHRPPASRTLRRRDLLEFASFSRNARDCACGGWCKRHPLLLGRAAERALSWRSRTTSSTSYFWLRQRGLFVRPQRREQLSCRRTACALFSPRSG